MIIASKYRKIIFATEPDKALPLYQRALEIYEETLGPEHPNFVVILNNLTSLLLSYGN